MIHGTATPHYDPARRTDQRRLRPYGFAGNYIAEAPDFVGSVGALVDNLGRWYGSLQIRILGSYPLITDNSQKDAGYTETNLSVGYKVDPHLRAQVEIHNLFDVKPTAFAYCCQTMIPGDPARWRVRSAEPSPGSRSRRVSPSRELLSSAVSLHRDRITAGRPH